MHFAIKYLASKSIVNETNSNNNNNNKIEPYHLKSDRFSLSAHHLKKGNFTAVLVESMLAASA